MKAYEIRYGIAYLRQRARDHIRAAELAARRLREAYPELDHGGALRLRVWGPDGSEATVEVDAGGRGRQVVS